MISTLFWRRCVLPVLFLTIWSLPSQSQSCDCTDYIYLNETSNGGRVHKYATNPDGSLTEIFNAGNSWYPGANASILPSPHGLAADINGYLYINSNFNNGDLYKLDCDGNIDPTPVVDLGNMLANLATIGNTIYANTGNSYDTCSGMDQGSVCLEGVSAGQETWGFWYDENTGYFYSTFSFGAGSGNLYRYTLADWGSGVCVPPFITAAEIQAPYSGTGVTRGVTTDNAGNIYLTIWSGSGRDGAVVKFSPDGNTILASTAVDSDPNDGGWYWATSPVYSPSNDVLYVSTQSNIESCVWAFNASDLSDVGEVVAPSGDSGQGQAGFQQAKAMSINTECCPTDPNASFDASICPDDIDDSPIFLNALLENCEGPICGESWVPSDAASQAIFNACDETITPPSSMGCFEYKKTGSNSQCGAFDMTLTVCFECPPPPCPDPNCFEISTLRN